VLALKANYRGRVKGIVHEVSATGQTVFVEPEDVVEKNNDILIEERRLAAEVARVLREMTARIGEKRAELEDLRNRVLAVDGLHARARYSVESRGVFALDGSDVAPRKRSRTPQAGSTWSRRAIRSSVSKPCPSTSPWILSRASSSSPPEHRRKDGGPQDVGLFALMNQFGLALPADEGTILPSSTRLRRHRR
jgi:DNA mismatch repair protein MutS2